MVDAVETQAQPVAEDQAAAAPVVADPAPEAAAPVAEAPVDPAPAPEQVSETPTDPAPVAEVVAGNAPEAVTAVADVVLNDEDLAIAPVAQEAAPADIPYVEAGRPGVTTLLQADLDRLHNLLHAISAGIESDVEAAKAAIFGTGGYFDRMRGIF